MPTAAFTQQWAPIEFKQRLAKRLMLTPNELPALDDMLATARPVRRRQDIVMEGKRSRSVYLVIDGFLMRYRILRSGQRQVVNVVVPGDVTGAPSCFYNGALYSIKTLTNAVVAPVPLDLLLGFLDTHPRFAAKVLWMTICDAAISVEHVVVVGRRTARERIAHFLLELLTRLKAAGLASDSSYQMPFSQDVIADALGLSLAYVNRELRALTDEGLVLIVNRHLVITDVAALSELADFEHRYLQPSAASELFTPRPGLPATALGARAMFAG